jgi:hypothetical protein
MLMNIYTSGARVRSIANFVDVTGAAADPTATVFKYKIGTGAVQTPAPIRDALGDFHYDIDTSGWAGPGIETVVCQWAGTGAVQAIDDDYFGIKAPSL